MFRKALCNSSEVIRFRSNQNKTKYLTFQSKLARINRTLSTKFKANRKGSIGSGQTTAPAALRCKSNPYKRNTPSGYPGRLDPPVSPESTFSQKLPTRVYAFFAKNDYICTQISASKYSENAPAKPRRILSPGKSELPGRNHDRTLRTNPLPASRPASDRCKQVDESMNTTHTYLYMNARNTRVLRTLTPPTNNCRPGERFGFGE